MNERETSLNGGDKRFIPIPWLIDMPKKEKEMFLESLGSDDIEARDSKERLKGWQARAEIVDKEKDKLAAWGNGEHEKAFNYEMENIELEENNTELKKLLREAIDYAMLCLNFCPDYVEEANIKDYTSKVEKALEDKE